ncbi:MAG: tRNA (5-methylaminomethyl-2-thiouridine)(34)-methyltransferase MnmD [Crocinitomicaceae bacterium]
MKRELIITDDGSNSIYIPEMDETYHSTHGAIQEAKHVFIEQGLKRLGKTDIKILEMGLGTGLNVLLSAIESERLNVKIDYVGIEAFPVESEIFSVLNYTLLIGEEHSSMFNKIHDIPWGSPFNINDHFILTKNEIKIQNYLFKKESFDIVYYDAFGPRVQSELWSVEVLEKIFESLKKGGFLVTYCAQGQFKRNLKEVGFEVEVLPGPLGKREMTLAIRQ